MQFRPNIPVIQCSALTATLIDGPRLFIKVVGVRFVQIEALCGVRYRRTVLRLVRERCARQQNRARQVSLGAAVGVPLVGQLGEHQQQTSEICFTLGGGLGLLMSSAECKEYIWEGWHKEVAGSLSGGSLKS